MLALTAEDHHRVADPGFGRAAQIEARVFEGGRTKKGRGTGIDEDMAGGESGKSIAQTKRHDANARPRADARGMGCVACTDLPHADKLDRIVRSAGATGMSGSIPLVPNPYSK